MADTESEEQGMTFNSIEEELEYWKDKAMEYRQKLEEVRQEFDEFLQESRELEGELTVQLEQAEASNKDLLTRVTNLEDENEMYKVKAELQQSEMYVSVTTLQEERSELLALKDTLQKYVRQLEQNNDDLERGKRVTMSSLEDFELKMNRAFERNAILENELDEKQRLAEMCQRLKDEVRDLHSELSRQTRKKGHSEDTLEEGGGVSTDTEPMFTTPAPSTQPSTTADTPSTQVAPSSSLIKVNTTPQGTPLHATFTGTQNYTPSTRISALNMVGDLLRKVGALESRLASCRTHLSTKEKRTSSPVDTPKVKRMHINKYNGEAQTTSAHLTKITV